MFTMYPYGKVIIESFTIELRQVVITRMLVTNPLRFGSPCERSGNVGAGARHASCGTYFRLERCSTHAVSVA